MVALHPQFLMNASQATTAVLVPWDEWQAMLEELEELDAFRAYDEAKSGSQESLPFEEAVRELGDLP